MAKKQKPKPSMSDRVREYLKEHPDAGPSEVTEALSEFGVTIGLVSNVKNRMKKQGLLRWQPAAELPDEPEDEPEGEEEIPSPILAAVKLIQSCGSADAAKKTIDLVVKIGQLTS